jgi:chromosome segregation protein
VYLKSLTVKGFKSFADRTHMQFDPGLTVVVGPNGSGKSNVSDAILWVLGEQSAKQLRGNAMEDVIFSGSSARKPVGVAEVTLVLDNSDHTLPVDFDEVGITRRMYRSGESEYLINGSPARLMDIQDILHDSGLGKDTHSIISQGKLDSILSSRPEERRSLVEEAAGISKHRRRKERSQKKLKDMEANVVRARDLNREINRQLRPLERQVDKAKRYNDLAERKGFLETTLAVDDLRRLQAEWKAVAARGNEADAAVELARYRLDEKSRNLEKLQSMLEQKGLFVGDLGEQRRRIQQQLGRIDSDMRLLEEKGRNMVDKLSEMRMTLSTVDKQRADAAAELEQSSRELEEAVAKQELARTTLNETGPAADEAAQARRRLDEAHAQLVARQRSVQRENDQAVLARARLKEQISNATVEDEMYESRISQIDETIGTAEEALVAARARQAELEHDLEEARKKLNGSQAEIDAASKAMREARGVEDAKRRAVTEAEAQLNALKRVDAQVDDASPLVKQLVDAAGTDVECRLGDTISAPTELEPIIERLLGPELAALVVAGDTELEKVSSKAASLKKSSGSATIVSRAGAAQDMPQSTVGMRLLDGLDVAPESVELLGRVLGNVWIVDAVGEAVSAHASNPGCVFVSRDGATVYPDGRCVVGTPGDRQGGVLERKRELRELEASIPRLKQEFETAQASSKDAQKALNQARDAQGRLKGDVSRLRAESDAGHKECGRLEAEVKRATAERDQIAKRRAQAAERSAKAKPQLEEYTRTADETERTLKEIADELSELESARAEAVEDEQVKKAKANDAKLELATVTERRRHLEVRTEELAAREKDLEKRREAALTGSRSLEVLRLRIDPLHERYEAVREVARTWAERLRDRASLAEADSDSLKKTINDAKAEVAEANAALEAANAAAQEIKVESGRLEVHVESAVKCITESGYMPLEEALALEEPEDRERLERELEQVDKKISSLGPVNQVAMEEYTKLKERSDYLAKQLADLESARDALNKITNAIERKMRTRFLETFEQVNANFSQIFSMLFPGGKAHLEMTDPDHPGETGIEVVAQPRGKRIPKLVLMSGGEKSLCALALLFAVYKTRTVPFYVFDEVEAALDDSNLDKLLGAIEQLKQDTQLIVISHQRRTMEQADVLYGVSMQADGVSRVISQRLDKATGKVVDA